MSLLGLGCGCSGQPPTPVVTFDGTWFTTWTTMFPAFCALTEAQGQAYFTLATLYVENSTRNPAWCAGILPQLLYLVTAHVAWLLAPRDANGNPAAQGTPASPIVGRINSATQGSVSVGAALDGEQGSPSQQFYMQSPYGMLAWQAMAALRTFRYTVNPTNVGNLLAPLGLNSVIPAGFWTPGFAA